MSKTDIEKLKLCVQLVKDYAEENDLTAEEALEQIREKMEVKNAD